MIDGERVIAVVPARGGSKAVPRKNVREVGGNPLVVWSIDSGRSVEYIDRVIVSTDDDEIARIALQNGAEVYRRPAQFATDTALVVDALRDLIQTLKTEGETARVMVLLEPTCPFRSVDDVRACIEDLVRAPRDSVATFKEADLNPHRAWRLHDGSPVPFIPGAVAWLPRQELPAAYQLNGAVYVFRADLLPAEGPAILFGRMGAVVMPRERSFDIDSELDLFIAEAILQHGGPQ